MNRRSCLLPKLDCLAVKRKLPNRVLATLACVAVTSTLSIAQIMPGGGTPHYDIAYSGGTWSTSGQYGTYTGNDTGNGPHGGGATTGGPGPGGGGGGIVALMAGPGSASCSGTITATFTWNNAGNPANVPPKAILIQKSASAGWSGDSGSCSNGLGHTVTTSTYSGYVSGDYYEVKQNPATSFTVTCSPSASTSLGANSPSGMLAGSCSVSFSVNYYALDINFTGGKGTNDAKEYLIGQHCGASVTLSSQNQTLPPPGLSVNDTDWSVSGGEPYTNYAINSWINPYTQWSSTLTNFSSPQTGPSLSCHFKVADGETVQAHVRIVLPPGALPSPGPTADLERTCTSVRPQSIQLGVTIGSPVATLNGSSGFVQLNPPMQYSGSILTQTGFGGPGQWSLVQLITTSDQRKNNGVWEQLYEDVPTTPNATTYSLNGSLCLDNTYPYDGWSPAPYPPVPPQQITWYGSQDYPGESLEASVNIRAKDILDSFQDYMLYLPPGGDSLPVPVKKFTWYWEFHAAKDTNDNWVVSGTNAQWGFGADFPEFPIWGIQLLNDSLYYAP